jgi:hypothetical protein
MEEGYRKLIDSSTDDPKGDRDERSPFFYPGFRKAIGAKREERAWSSEDTRPVASLRFKSFKSFKPFKMF